MKAKLYTRKEIDQAVQGGTESRLDLQSLAYKHQSLCVWIKDNGLSGCAHMVKHRFDDEGYSFEVYQLNKRDISDGFSGDDFVQVLKNALAHAIHKTYKAVDAAMEARRKANGRGKN